MAAIPVPIVAANLVHANLQQPVLAGPLGLLAGQPLESLSVVAMGLEPYLDAFVIFWLLGIVSREAGTARSDPAKAWPYLFWLTLGLASLRAFGLTRLLLQDHRAALTSGLGLTTMFALVLGTMAFLGLGRLIDRFGTPRSYGVWFLFGIGSLIKGVHSLAFFIAADQGDRFLTGIIAIYGLISMVLLASTVLVFDGVRAVSLYRRGRNGKDVQETSWPVHILIGGFIVPVVIASVAIGWPLIIIQLVTGWPPEQAALYWSPSSSYLVVAIAYSLVFCLLVIAACFATMYLNQDFAAAAQKLAADGHVIPGVPPGRASGRYLSRVATAVTALGSLWMAGVVVLCPIAFEAMLGPSRPRLPLGGGPFVVTAAVLINAGKKVRQGG